MPESLGDRRDTGPEHETCPVCETLVPFYELERPGHPRACDVCVSETRKREAA